MMNVLFPILLIPTIIVLIIWHCTNKRQQVSFWAMCTAYFKGFYWMGVLVGIYRLTWIMVIIGILINNDVTDSQYYFMMFLYAVFGVGFSSEFAKYKIASRGRRDRPDLVNVLAYLWYSIAGALGYSTFIIAMETFMDTYVDIFLTGIFVVLMVFTVLELPLDVLTGAIIGIGVAKNEVYKWSMPGIKIWGLPWLIRSISAIAYWIVSDFSIIGMIVIDAVLVIGASIYLRYHSKNTPEYFTLPSEDPDAQGKSPKDTGSPHGDEVFVIN